MAQGDRHPAAGALPWGGRAIVAAAVEALADAGEETVVLEDYRPLAECLDWQLGQLAWGRRGCRAFLSDRVPMAVTSDGRLSRNAAELLFLALRQAEGEGTLGPTVPVLEVGAGLGLFARGFLDAFRELCQTHGRDYYGRLLYLATDASAEMLRDLAAHGVLSAHAGRFELRQVDALRLQDGTAGAAPEGFWAMFFNYVFDTLPAAVLRYETGGVSQLWVQTCLAKGVNLSDFTPMGLDEIRRRAASADPAERGELVGVSGLFSLSSEFRPVALDALPYGDLVARLAAPGHCLLHSHGAIGCLEAALPRLRHGGFALLSDYGQTEGVTRPEPWDHQRFGSSSAIGLNFPLLEAHFREVYPCDWVSPAAESGPLYSRLLGRGVAGPVADAFRRLFDKAAADWANEPLERARELAQQGDHDAALREFSTALERQGANWAVLDEIARFLVYTTRDYARGAEIARLALDLNPVSPELWNTCGDALYYLDRIVEAHAAFLRAQALNPDDPRAYLNLAYTHAWRKDYDAALRMIAEGLRCDSAGTCQDNLLQQQQSILAALAARRQQEEKCVAHRAGRPKQGGRAGGQSERVQETSRASAMARVPQGCPRSRVAVPLGGEAGGDATV